MLIGGRPRAPRLPACGGLARFGLVTGASFPKTTRLGLLTATLLLPADPAAPASPPQVVPAEESFSGSVQVSIVNVDVYVTDRDGNPVTGLTAGDFEVFDDGEPVEVSNFYAVENGRPTAPAVPEPAAAEPAAPPGPIEPAREELPPERASPR